MIFRTQKKLLFQSTPVIANGRIPRGYLRRNNPQSFNPRPLLLTGESRPDGEQGHRIDGFNPRPLLLTGESPFLWDAHSIKIVSIHARYC